MSFKKLQEFIDLAKAAGASELSYKDGDKEFSIGFPSVVSSNVSQTVSPVSFAASAQPIQNNTQSETGIVEITSPFVGTFYGASAPGEPNFINIGDKISEGKVLCIIEAMKIMNEIESEISGEIVEICVENESYVPYGEVLFKVRKS